MPIFITEENISQYIFPQCCHPIPDDDILGYINNHKHIEIHKRACRVAAKLKSSYGNRILDAQWQMHHQLLFDATIQIRGIDRMGMLHDLADVISGQLNVNMRKITISSNDGIFDGIIELRVYNRKDVQVIMDKLKKIKDLKEIQHIV